LPPGANLTDKREWKHPVAIETMSLPIAQHIQNTTTKSPQTPKNRLPLSTVTLLIPEPVIANPFKWRRLAGRKIDSRPEHPSNPKS
jgi:hypothetical protein